MKKWGLIFILASLLAIGFVSAAINDSSDAIGKGYQCLKDQVDKKSSLSLQETFFSGLAIGANSKLNSKIESEKGANCWPKAGCTLKDTSLGLFVYDRMNKETDKIEEWLLSKNTTALDLVWYLEIDIPRKVPSVCTIKYTGNEKTVGIGEDMKISGNAGTCLSVSPSGYWLKIKDSCYGENFQVSCNEDFVTALIYQKKSGDTVYVSSATHSAASSGTTEEKVSAQCFRTGNSCDYEGSLWAAIALQKANKDVSSFVPYLIALSSDNQKYLPSSFLYMLTGGDDQYSELVQNQKQGKFWEASASPNGKFYDTSLAMLALQNTNANELNDAKNYLLSVQGKDGCWNNDNIRDTAFILYSGWVRQADSGGGGGGGQVLCSEGGYTCENVVECNNAGGQVLDNYECNGFGQFCCSVKVQEQTCSQKKGIVCASNEECSGASESSAEGSCCLGTCQQIQTQDTCTPAGKFCSNVCNSDEQQTSEVCPAPGQVCCEPKPTTGGSSMKLWIIILVIAIVLVLMAILFRNKLRIWLFKLKSGVKTGPINRPRPPFVGQPMIQRPAPRFSPRPAPSAQQRPAARKPVSQSDKEMEETLRKLKEMSK